MLKRLRPTALNTLDPNVPLSPGSSVVSPSSAGVPLSPGSSLANLSNAAAPGQQPSTWKAGRRSSAVSTVSSSGGGQSKTTARSLLSTAAHGTEASSSGTAGAASTSTGPVIEGNVATLSGIDCGEPVICVKHTENAAAIVAGLFSGTIKIFNAQSGVLVSQLDADSGGTAASDFSLPVSRIRCKPSTIGTGGGEAGATPQHPHQQHHLHPQQALGGANTILAATYSSGHLRVWNYASGTCVGQVQDDRTNAEYLCLSYNPFVDVIAVGIDNGTIKLYDERTLQVVSLLRKSLDPSKFNGHTDRVLCIENHPLNPHEFVSSGWDNTLQFWDARCPNSVRSVSNVFVCGDGLTFDKRGREILVASWRPDSQLQTVEYATGAIKVDYEPTPQNHYLTCARYLGKDYIVAGGTNRGVVRIYDRHKSTVLATVREISPVYDIDVPRKGVGAIATAGNKFIMTSLNNIVVMDYFKNK